MADLEAYVNNTGPKAGDDKVAAGPIAASAGPGHNAFIMICAALVLFMTLPGLFLFYGGLVRSKNILSVAAQCFGLAGMVAILWWAVGYSLVFGKSFDGTLLGLLDTRLWGAWLLWISAILTVWSMVYYLQKAIPEIRARSR